MKKPWYKHDAEAWLSDPMLRACSPGARGLLEDLMCLAHIGEPYGQVAVRGVPCPEHALSKALAIHGQTLGKLLAELERNGRIVKADSGAWSIPRMVRDHQNTLRQREFGKMGGSPTLKAPLKANITEGVKIESESESESESDVREGLRSTTTGRFAQEWKAFVGVHPDCRTVTIESFTIQCGAFPHSDVAEAVAAFSRSFLNMSAPFRTSPLAAFRPFLQRSEERAVVESAAPRRETESERRARRMKKFAEGLK